MTPFLFSSLRFTRPLHALLLCVLMSVCSLGMTQVSDVTATGPIDHDSVQQLMRQARYAEALSNAETFLLEHPRDPQMLFMRAKLLLDLKRTDDAFDQLSTLSLIHI